MVSRHRLTPAKDHLARQLKSRSVPDLARDGEECEAAVPARPLLMSLRPRFAHAILSGRKTVELRRNRIAAISGTTVILYASAPVMSVVGMATLDATDIDQPAALWRRHRGNLDLTRAEFDHYLTGADTACALTITRPTALPDPYTLAWLREHAHFQPPQSYRYLAHKDPAPLHALVTLGR